MAGLYLEEGKSAAQIAKIHGVSKSAVIACLHRMGIRSGNGKRQSNPDDQAPPYGYKKVEGKLVVCRKELRIARMIIHLINDEKMSLRGAARELGRKGHKNRRGSTKWHNQTVKRIYDRWNEKA